MGMDAIVKVWVGIDLNDSEYILDILCAVTSLGGDQHIGGEHPYGWLRVFDKEELNEFIQEVLLAYRLSDFSEESLKGVAAIIHEWHESAIAIASPDLEYSFGDGDEIDEVPLTQVDDIGRSRSVSNVR